MTWDSSGLDGLAWTPTIAGGRLLAVAGNAAVARLGDPPVSDTIDKLHAYFDQVIGSPKVDLLVYETANLDADPTVDTHRPDTDEANQEWTGVPDDTDRYTNIDEASPPDESDYLEFTTSTGAQATSGFSFSTLSTFAASGQIYAVRLRAWFELLTGNSLHANGASVRMADASGTAIDTEVKNLQESDGVVAVTLDMDTNPDTNYAWTAADVAGFDGSTYVAQVRCSSSGSDYTMRCFALEVEVEYDASLLAKGTAQPAGDGWAVATLDSSWSLTAGVDYAVLAYRVGSSGQVVWPLLDAGEACPHAGWANHLPSMVGRRVDDLGDKLTGVHPLVLETSGAAASADSQPYALLSREAVHSGRTVEQEITPQDSKTIGWVRVVVACHPDTSDDLTVEVKDRSSDALVGTLTVAPDDLPDPDSPRMLQTVDGALDTAASVDTSQHYVRLSSTAPEATGWQAAVVDAAAPPVSAETAGFGGVTDEGTVAGVEDDDIDVPAVIGVAPAAPTGFSASAGSTGGTVDLAWTATSLGGSFKRYEVLRSGVAIAHITSEATTSLTDTGALQGVAETWEIRVRDTDGVVSQTVTATATAAVAAESFRLTSLADPSADIDLIGQEGAWDFTFVEQLSVSQPMGGVGARMLRSTGGRRDEVALTVWLETGEGRALFDGLLAARDADVDHLVWTSEWGDRLYCGVVVDGGRLPYVVGSLGAATVRLVEVADRPTPAEIA